MQNVRVALDNDRSYNVTVGSGAVRLLSEIIATVAPKARRAAIVTQSEIVESSPMVATLDLGISSRQFIVGNGEAHKNLATIDSLCSQFARWSMNRNDVIVAVGGGMVTDIGGFAASCYHRGIQVIYVSTTLLGMIDAAVGGKTGVNLGEGKNLVGAFWQPSAVVCDMDFLSTLPTRELHCGLGEMAKYHFLERNQTSCMALRFLSDNRLLDPTFAPLEERVVRSIEMKAEVVSADEREAGVRATLNYGHTLAHALEIASDFRIMHGEAVAIGLQYAAAVALELGRIDRARFDLHGAVLDCYGLEKTVGVSTVASDDQLIQLMYRDKKALDGLTFVLDGPVGVEQVSNIAERNLKSAFSYVR